MRKKVENPGESNMSNNQINSHKRRIRTCSSSTSNNGSVVGLSIASLSSSSSSSCNKKARVSLQWLRRAAVSWDRLPRDCLAPILDKLGSAEDYLRFKSVCRAWRLAAALHDGCASYPAHPHLLITPLTLTTTQSSPKLYDARSDWVLDFELKFPPGFANDRVIGSSLGWLISVSVDWNVSLCNPFLGFTIRNLPPLPRCSFYLCSRITNGKGHFNICRRGILSADPITDPENATLVIICDFPFRLKGLAFLRLHQESSSWTFLNYATPLHDILITHDKLLAVDKKGCLLAWDSKLLYYQPTWARTSTDPHAHCGGVFSMIIYDLPQLLSSVPHLNWNSLFLLNHEPWNTNSLTEDQRYYHINYVVKTHGGRILLAVQLIDESFKVFELDSGQEQWVERTSLGNDTLFLGTAQSLALSASHFSGCQPGCIYYAPNLLFQMKSYRGQYNQYEKKMGIFNLERRCFEPLYTWKPRPGLLDPRALPLWIVPTIHDAKTTEFS